MGLVLLSHESILSLPGLGLSPVFPSSEVTSFITPLQDTLLYCNGSVRQVGFSCAPVVCGWIIFSEVITNIHVSWFQFYLKVLLFHSIIYPIKSRVHGFISFLFDGSSHYAIFRGIVCDYFSGLLPMAHIYQGCLKCL